MQSAVRFLAKHCDSDIILLLKDSVPPADISKVGSFRAAIGKFDKKACCWDNESCIL